MLDTIYSTSHWSGVVQVGGAIEDFILLKARSSSLIGPPDLADLVVLVELVNLVGLQ